MDASPRPTDGGPPRSSRAQPPTRAERAGIAALVRTITAELASPLARADVVAGAAAELAARTPAHPRSLDRAALRVLARALAAREGEPVRALAPLFAAAAAANADPWPHARALLRARDAKLAADGVDLALRPAAAGSVHHPHRLLVELARWAEREEASGDVARLAAIGRAWRRLAARDAAPREALADPELRRLAARVLDAEGADVAVAARDLLSADDFAFLVPYLAYLRAGHRDLLDLLPRPGGPPVALPSFRRAEATLGGAGLREVLAAVGLARANRGIEVRERVLLSFGGSFPSAVSPAEAALLGAAPGARTTPAPSLVLAHGGREGGGAMPGRMADRVARFRAYCLAHADVLQDFVDFEPVGPQRARRTVARMDALVAEHVALFGTHAAECAILPDVYASLRAEIAARLDAAPPDEPLDPGTTRLVRSFEDPANPAQVRTLHGLKRYLHQRSLRLAARLLADPSVTDRTVEILLVERGKPPARVPTVRWADLDAGARAEDRLPVAVEALVEAFAHNLLHGHREFPQVRVFVYGSEAHTYLTWWSHPAFLRVDRAPPLRGGLVDLEYFGVSKADLGSHPDPELPALRRFLEAADFDVEIDATRVHVRYDKERAVDAADVADRAAYLLRLAPYLMDLDWVMGSLGLDAAARARAADALQRSFAAWGVLPWSRLLTADRTGILAGEGEGPAAREAVWTGKGAFPASFTDVPSDATRAAWAEGLRGLGLDDAARGAAELRSAAPLDVARVILGPLREAVARGAVVERDGRLERAGHARFRPRHEAELFAVMLGSAEATAYGVRAARLASAMERSLRFASTGAVQGWPVQRARLSLGGAPAGLFVLRDPEGPAKLAIFARDAEASCRRASSQGRWDTDLFDDPAEVAALARRDGLLDEGTDVPGERVAAEAARVRAEVLKEAGRPAAALAGEAGVVEARRIGGGRACGRAVLAGGAEASDPDGGVLVLERLGPKDFARLRRAAAVVATAGSVLSHAGLVLGQQAKPAVLVPGRWTEEPDGRRALHVPRVESREETRDLRRLRVTLRTDRGLGEWTIRDGDLLVVDAEAGRLQVLGSAPATLSLHDDLATLRREGAALARARDPQDVLVRRGRVLRTAGRLRDAATALRDPVLAAHAAHEIAAGGADVTAESRRDILRALFANPHVGDAARARLERVAAETLRAAAAARRLAVDWMPSAESVGEVLALRLDALERAEAARVAARTLAESGRPRREEADAPSWDELDRATRRALHRLRAQVRRTGPGIEGSLPDAIDALLGVRLPRRAAVAAPARGALADRVVLGPEDGGAELSSRIGAKAAGLAAIARVLGPGAVPAWFALGDAAWRRMLAAPAGDRTLADALAATLQRDAGTAERSAAVRRLFERTPLPEDVAAAVADAYRALRAAGEPEDAVVAVRSSGFEEDLPREPRAGEFETFLGVRGAGEVDLGIRRAWAGLWTERAIERRAELGLPALGLGGGVLVQRLVAARVSGVVRTRGARGAAAREMLVEAGLGLGEGLVSGAIAADEIRVLRTPGEPGLHRFRYVIHEKAEQVVPDRTAGQGTVRVVTKSHQRMRPALEWIELDELVRAAGRLETAWGWPLDLEFAFDGSGLRLLQARPLPAFFAALRETLERRPIGRGRARSRTGEEEP